MRLWSLHPKYLDTIGLVALWREALLAQKVLRRRTKGYRMHPQLHRFAEQTSPVGAIASYLRAVLEESRRRGFRFNARKIAKQRTRGRISCTHGQLLYEWKHLRKKLKMRTPHCYRMTSGIALPEPHPLFSIVKGGIESWEKTPKRNRNPKQV